MHLVPHSSNTSLHTDDGTHPSLGGPGVHGMPEVGKLRLADELGGPCLGGRCLGPQAGQRTVLGVDRLVRARGGRPRAPRHDHVELLEHAAHGGDAARPRLGECGHAGHVLGGDVHQEGLGEALSLCVGQAQVHAGLPAPGSRGGQRYLAQLRANGVATVMGVGLAHCPPLLCHEVGDLRSGVGYSRGVNGPGAIRIITKYAS